jgi:uncharacterized membrane protein YgdD (TMEM256/DUF423 family)
MSATAWDRTLVALGALAGLAGVALSAAAAHVTGPGSLDTAARFLLFHAPALLALAVLAATGIVHPRLARAAGLALALGLVLFSGDLTARALLGSPLFPMAAPSGGVVLMLGWASIALAALLPTRARSPERALRTGRSRPDAAPRLPG